MRSLVLSVTNVAFLAAATAQMVSTVQDGSFHSPSTWSCNCIPAVTQPLTIGHHVTFDVEVEFHAPVVILPSGSLTATEEVNVESGYGLDVQGLLNAYYLGLFLSSPITVTGTVNVISDIQLVGQLILQGGHVSIGNDLIMFDQSSVSGNGTICFVGNVWNTNGSVSGTIDVCDTSPTSDPPYITGNVASTITWCSSGICAVGIDSNEQAAVTIRQSGDQLIIYGAGNMPGNWWIFDASGRMQANGAVAGTTGDGIIIPTSGMKPGFHLFKIRTSDRRIVAVGKFVLEP